MEFSGRPLDSDKIHLRSHPLLGALVWVLNKAGVVGDAEDGEDAKAKQPGVEGGDSDSSDDSAPYGRMSSDDSIGGNSIGLRLSESAHNNARKSAWMNQPGKECEADLPQEERTRRFQRTKQRQSWSDDSGQNLVE